MKYFENLEVYPTAVGYCISWDADVRVNIKSKTLKTDGAFVWLQVPHLWGLEVHNNWGLSPSGGESAPYITINGDWFMLDGPAYDSYNGHWISPSGFGVQKPKWSLRSYKPNLFGDFEVEEDLPDAEGHCFLDGEIIVRD